MTREKRGDIGTAVLGASLLIVLILGTGLISAWIEPRPVCCPAFLKRPEAARSFNAEETIAPWVAMWNSYDLSEVDRLFLPDDRVTYFSSEKEGLIRGIGALREHHAGFGFIPGGKARGNKLWVDGLSSQVFGDTAVVTGIWHFQRAQTPEKAQHGPFTFVYVKSGSEYRIAHGHFANAPAPAAAR